MPEEQIEESPHRREYGKQIEEMREELRELKDRLDPVIKIWEELSGFVTVLCWVGKILKWATGVVLSVAAAWAAIFHLK